MLTKITEATWPPLPSPVRATRCVVRATARVRVSAAQHRVGGRSELREFSAPASCDWTAAAIIARDMRASLSPKVLIMRTSYFPSPDNVAG